MRIYLYLSICFQYLAKGSSDEVETASVSVAYDCISAVDASCCPDKCILNNNIDNVDISACLDAIQPHCELSMTAKSMFDQTPCFVEIKSPFKTIKRYSSWYRFPSGLKVLKLPWITGHISAQETKNRPHGCHVIQAGLADAPSDNCQPLPDSSLFEVPWINGTLGELDGLIAMAGHRQALNVISEVWLAGESNGLPNVTGLDIISGQQNVLLYPHWEARCDPPGHQYFQMEVKGSAFGRKGLRPPDYEPLPP